MVRLIVINMARPKKEEEAVVVDEVVVKQPITTISEDFNNEGLVNMAKKINEIIARMNGYYG